MPSLIKGHNYLLLVSHFTSDNQSGYSLSFNGGTASITDTTKPRLQSASASCDATKLTVKINKKVKCASMVTTGNPTDFDFRISYPLTSIINVSGFNCSNSFDMDSVIVTLSNPLPPGNYTLTAQNGSDGNTLLDNCGTAIVPGDNIPVEILPIQPTPMDSIQPVGCAPGTLQLVFKKSMRCSSIAADGSDFTVTGPTGNIAIAGASGICDSNNTSPVININLVSPIVTGGLYHITLRAGTDGNTVIDECGQETPAGATLDIMATDTVSADFSYQVLYGCVYDTVIFSQPGNNGINQWNWSFEGLGRSAQQNPQVIYTVFGNKNEQLIVSNGVCSDTVSKVVALDNELDADFETENILCPEDVASFRNNSIGNIISWNWDLGDGTIDIQPTPADHNYPNNGREKIYDVRLIVSNNIGCYDTAYQQIRKLRSCYIAVPNAFTPNGDGINDFLYPLNAYKAEKLEFRVYNRYGQLVFETKDWTKKWDGTINGKEQGTGTYVWTLQYTDTESGKKISRKGTSVLIR